MPLDARLPIVLLAAALASASCAGAPRAEPCVLPHSSVGAVQGSGTASPLQGRQVTVQGVVVGDYEGAGSLRGFHIQDVRGDGDPATSDGVFVFNADGDDVAAGDVVRVTGTVSEVREQTQIAATAIVACGTGTVAPAALTLPLDSATALERFEGMLVRLPQTLHVTGLYRLGRFGEVVLSSGGRLPQPTNVAAPGAPARAVQARNDLNRIMLDDGLLAQNPDPIAFARGGRPLSADNTLRGGDQVPGLVGVLTQTWGGAAASPTAYRVVPVNALGGGVPDFTAANPRTAEPPDVGGTLRLASFNLLNYFNTFDGCSAGTAGPPVDCRGAADAAEFDRQWRKTAAAIIAMDAAVVGVLEMENDGYGPTSAIADLTGRLNTATSPGRYAFIDADAATGIADVLGGDAIKVGLIYQPARVTPSGRTAVLRSDAFVNAGDAVARNRPALAQTFRQSDGAQLVIVINHWKSKGSACDTADSGDGQAQCNAVRVTAAREMVRWLETDPTGTGEQDVLILGDLNAYALEDPISVLKQAGYTDLIAAHVGTHAYSYVFNGQWGYLDHALASPTLVAQVSGAAEWHINADEPPVLDYNVDFMSTAQRTLLYNPDPYRSSDHDPVMVGVRLTADRDP